MTSTPWGRRRTPSTLPRLHGLASVEAARKEYGYFFFAGVAGVALVGALILSMLPAALAASTRALLLTIHLVTAGIASLVWRENARNRFELKSALMLVALAAMLLVGGDALILNVGLRSPAMGFCGLVIFCVSALAGARSAVMLVSLGGVEMALLGWAESHGWITGLPAPTPVMLALLVQWMLILCAGCAGAGICGILEQYIRASENREEHVHGLLRIAADWYWEQDDHFRFTAVWSSSDATLQSQRGAQTVRWDLNDMGLSADQLRTHRADLAAHRPFQGLRARRRDEHGHWRTISLSGHPKFDALGTFTGYWGVARDVTREVRNERAVASSETRYRELFARSPSPLLLHRQGIVVDANEAAARLLGFPSASAMTGFNIVGLFQTGEFRDRMIERLAALDRLGVGAGLGVAEFQIRSLDGRPLSVQSTAVRVDTSSGPANLTIIFDITARKAAEGALRRSEALLTHLFATNPDCITLTELTTGRYAMVNPAFSRLTEYSAEEVMGKTSLEIGLWRDVADRERLIRQLERDGTVVDMPTVFVSKSGRLVSMLLSVGRFVMDERDYMVINARDVTETERTRLQHTAILESASIGIAFTRDRCFAQTNPFFERMFGWEPGSLLGLPGQVLWANDAEYREIGRQAGPLLAAGLPFEGERRMKRRDGSEFWCRMMAQAVDRSDPTRGGTIWITEDVTERRRLDEAIAAARDAAEAASQAKGTFLANTSHEIRTPLNGLLGLTRLAMQNDVPAARRQQYLAQILNSAQSLADIMSDILDVSKIESGKFTLEDVPFDVHQALEAVAQSYAPLAEAKGLLLRLAIDADVPVTVHGDPVRVRQILSNFVTNALKFTDAGEVVVHASAQAEGFVKLTVTDTGPGMSLQTQAKLFERFSQGDSSTTRRYGGTGLGLSICRELAQLMGGRVGVDSTEGAGSTFWAELPLLAAAATPIAPSTEAQDVERLRGVRVLLAEDNPVNMMIGVAMLERWGVQVEQVCDGRAAVEAVRRASHDGEPFDAVLMDVQMPVMSGHEAVRALRHAPEAQTLPIIALTAAALVTERDAALDAGMDAFLTKPVDAVKLRSTLVGLVRRPVPTPDARPAPAAANTAMSQDLGSRHAAGAPIGSAVPGSASSPHEDAAPTGPARVPLA